MEKIKVMVIMENEEKERELVNMLTNIDYIDLMDKIPPGADLAIRLIGVAPDVLLLERATAGDGYQLVEKLNDDEAEIITIMVEDEIEKETIRKAVFSGARDVLLYPVTAPQLLDSVYKCYQKEQKKNIQKRTPKSETRKKKKAAGNIVGVYSNKGGVGKTFLAVNLATSLALREKERVALVDLDLDAGSAALVMNLISHFTLSDVINDIRNLDRDLLESYMLPHSSGVMVLASPAQPRLNEFINADHISAILKILQSSFDYIVVDLPTRISKTLEPVFQEAEQLMVVVNQDLATIQNVKSFLVGMETLNFPQSRIKVVLNAFDTKREVRPKDIEVTLKAEIAGTIPADYRVASSSLNRGIPLALFNPRSKMSKGIDDLAAHIKQINGKAELKNWET